MRLLLCAWNSARQLAGATAADHAGVCCRRLPPPAAACRRNIVVLLAPCCCRPTDWLAERQQPWRRRPWTTGRAMSGQVEAAMTPALRGRGPAAPSRRAHAPASPHLMKRCCADCAGPGAGVWRLWHGTADAGQDHGGAGGHQVHPAARCEPPAGPPICHGQHTIMHVCITCFQSVRRRWTTMWSGSCSTTAS